ncbi:glycosyl hydrolase [Leptodontidium sp. 2 PMI_412]|nr:glycosyl hydrolase [Leptodontidium sp. 2 PMI_412]
MTPRDSNPLIPGFAPDPSITFIDGKYFLVTSSFHLFPGLPLYISDDAISWKHFANAISRKSQLSLSKSRTRITSEGDDKDPLLATGGLYAPTIRHRSGTTYIACTNVIHEEGESNPEFENFVISTTDVFSGNWSDPVYFDFHGIDPDIFFDDDGRTYIAGSSYTRGHPWISKIAIDCFEIDLQSGTKLTKQKEIWEGYSKLFPEGPHLYKRGPWYYLLVAEGGTTEGHRITISRAGSIWGPFVSHEKNPLLDVADPTAYIQHTGHGDLFQDLDGQWHMVCLGVRKRQNCYPMGRETFIAPVVWHEGGWPSVDPIVLNPSSLPRSTSSELSAGTSLICDAEAGRVYIRDPDLTRFQFADAGQKIIINPLPASFADYTQPITFVGARQRSLQGLAKVSLSEQSLESLVDLEAGLVYYRDELRFARIFWSSKESAAVFEFVNSARDLRSHHVCKLKMKLDGPVRFRIEYNESSLDFLCSGSGTPWEMIGTVNTLDISGSDFIGPVIGVFASAEHGSSLAHFSDFLID